MWKNYFQVKIRYIHLVYDKVFRKPEDQKQK